MFFVNGSINNEYNLITICAAAVWINSISYLEDESLLCELFLRNDILPLLRATSACTV